jgi:hypothetical protein
MSELSPYEIMVVRKFAAALRQAREEEFEKLRNTLYFLELFRTGLADLVAEMRRKNAAAAAQKPLTKLRDHLCEKCRSVKIIEEFCGLSFGS